MRTFLWLLMGGLLLAGCAKRPADPLEWKLAGSRPDELQKWLDVNLPLMTPKLGGELAGSLRNIKTTIQDPDPVKQTNIFCRKLEGRTVREVLIAGHKVSRDAAAARLERESWNLLQLTKMSMEASAADSEKLRARMAAAQKYVDQLKEQLAKIDSRLTELAWPHAG